MKKLYDADGIADAVNFKLSPAISKMGGGFACIEEMTCKEEVYVLCAQASMKTVPAVHFLACMDSARGKPTAKAQGCAQQLQLPWDDIQQCATGSQGEQLEEQAADYIAKHFPRGFSVPRLEINGKQQRDLDYDAILKTVCATGITAKACSSDSTTLVV